MTRSKLSDLEKQEIVALFEQKQETIPGLAHRYQVSASTIRRLLKQPNLDPIEPIAAIEATLANRPEPQETSEPPVTVFASKPKPITKAARTNAGGSAIAAHQESASFPAGESSEGGPIEPFAQGLDKDPKPAPRRPSRRQEEPEDAIVQTVNTPLSAFSPPLLRSESSLTDALSLESVIAPDQEELTAIIEEIGHGLEISRIDSNLEDDDEEDDDEEDEFDDLDEEGDDDDLGNLMLTARSIQLQPEVFIEVMPLEQADMPKTCYLVIDRTAELVTRPLKDFGELGQIPENEVQSRTLPVFDNHRIARRFSHRTHRIIKVPNGNMLKATCAQLSAKGITRLLVNGRIYAL